MTDRARLLGNVAAAWGVAGIAALLAFAVVRLGARGWGTLRVGLTPTEWIALAGLTALFVYAEGRQALQLRWVPGVMERLRRLRARPSPELLLLAPLHGLALVGVRGAVAARAWGGSLAVVAAVVIVSSFPDPWRGITDLAVSAALAWGLGAVLWQVPRLFQPAGPPA